MNSWIPRVVLCVALALVWVGAGDHDLHSPDEGRYASVSALMADGGSWIVPQFRGHEHLTKPPMTYWLQAMSLRVIWHNEWAVRLPSLIAQSGTVLVGFLYPPLDFYLGRVVASAPAVERLFAPHLAAPPKSKSFIFMTEPQWQ